MYEQVYMVHYIVHPITPQRRILDAAVELLIKHDGVCIYPTDTIYGIGACVSNPKAVEKLARIAKGNSSGLFSFICHDFSQASKYTKISNSSFKLLKHYLPGPYTFILPATQYVPKRIMPKRKTVGIRIPDNEVCLELVKLLNEPLANTSLNSPEVFTGNPDQLSPAMRNEIDVVLDAGSLEEAIDSTIIDLTGPEPILVRFGKGIWP